MKRGGDGLGGDGDSGFLTRKSEAPLKRGKFERIIGEAEGFLTRKSEAPLKPDECAHSLDEARRFPHSKE